nr:MAG TPA: hypothetical protein [Caudoviricetes sp.]
MLTADVYANGVSNYSVKTDNSVLYAVRTCVVQIHTTSIICRFSASCYILNSGCVMLTEACNIAVSEK